MTIQEAKAILGSEYDSYDEAILQKWIAAADGLTEVFFQTLEQKEE